MTNEQKEQLKKWIRAGLNQNECALLAHRDGWLTRETEREIEGVKFLTLKAEVKMEMAEILIAENTADVAKFWLTRKGGWVETKPFEFDGNWTLEAIEAFMAQLLAHRERLLASAKPKLLEGKSDGGNESNE